MYSTRQAATYVDMKFVTFVYHVNQGHVKEEYRLKGERMFNKAALDAFKKQYLSNAGMTKEQIAAKYGQKVTVVRGHLRRKALKPIAKNGGSLLYSAQDVARLAESLNWTEQTVTSNTDAVTT